MNAQSAYIIGALQALATTHRLIKFTLSLSLSLSRRALSVAVPALCFQVAQGARKSRIKPLLSLLYGLVHHCRV